jgi:formamidopyrimidine-DNA glycosylase
MPELPEVETVRRALERRVTGLRIVGTTVRETRLRRPVSARSLRAVEGQRIVAVRRRAKYLLLWTEADQALVIHLGMTGRVDLYPEAAAPPGKHDHVLWSLLTEVGRAEAMRFHDPRRFGLVLRLSGAAIRRHALFVHLGPEPMGPDFDGRYLYRSTRGSRRPIKNAVMDARLVVGVGNIYASEALWRARVNPKVASRRLGAMRCDRLHAAVVAVLGDAIEQGGTTLNDYRDPEGNSGYFRVRLDVYDREGQPCNRCSTSIRRIVQAGRSTYYCPGCQR